jgi:enoyl-CoA hydratase
VAEVSSKAGAVVITGRPGALSAGLDLKVVRDGTADERSALVTEGTAFFGWLLTVPIPVVISCTGHALAAGAMLLMAGDYRVGTRGDFRLGLTEVAVGEAVSTFGMRLAQTRLASERMLRSTALAEIVGPEEALRAGLLDELVEKDALEVALSRAQAFASLPREAFAASKERFYESVLAELPVS